jgi:hypothetical protein
MNQEEIYSMRGGRNVELRGVRMAEECAIQIPAVTLCADSGTRVAGGSP